MEKGRCSKRPMWAFKPGNPDVSVASQPQAVWDTRDDDARGGRDQQRLCGSSLLCFSDKVGEGKLSRGMQLLLAQASESPSASHGPMGAMWWEEELGWRNHLCLGHNLLCP